MNSPSAFVLPVFATAYPYIIVTLALASGGGFTLLLCLISDLLALVTLHLRICHVLASRVCLWQLDSLSGLWNLFRGVYTGIRNAASLMSRETMERSAWPDRLVRL